MVKSFIQCEYSSNFQFRANSVHSLIKQCFINASLFLNDIFSDFNHKLIEKMYFLRFANQVAVDDEVLVNEFDEINPAKVINVSSSLMQGFYAFIHLALALSISIEVIFIDI